MTTELCCWAQRTKLNTWESQAGDQHRTLEETLGDSSHPARIASIAGQDNKPLRKHSHTRIQGHDRHTTENRNLYDVFLSVVLHFSVGAPGPRWFAEDYLRFLVSFPTGLIGKHFGFNTLTKSHEPDEIGRQDVSTQIIKSTTCNVAR